MPQFIFYYFLHSALLSLYCLTFYVTYTRLSCSIRTECKPQSRIFIISVYRLFQTLRIVAGTQQVIHKYLFNECMLISHPNLYSS